MRLILSVKLKNKGNIQHDLVKKKDDHSFNLEYKMSQHIDFVYILCDGLTATISLIVDLVFFPV